MSQIESQGKALDVVEFERNKIKSENIVGVLVILFGQ